MEVKKDDRTIANPRVGPKKAKQFEEGELLFSTDQYKQQCDELEEKMRDFFQRHKY